MDESFAYHNKEYLTKTRKRRQRRKCIIKERKCNHKKHQLWNSIATALQLRVKQGNANNYLVKNNNPYCSQKEYKWEDAFYCKYHNDTHVLSTSYIKNPMDCDALVWYEDDVLIGYTLF
jgi:hypothetical protein